MAEPNEFTESTASAVEWQAPPPPVNPPLVEDPPQMSEAATLGNIFFEPGRTFEDLRRKPRFIIALLLMTLVITAFQFLFVQKIGDDQMRRFALEQIEKSPQTSAMTAEQKKQAVDMNMKVGGFIRYLIPVFVIIGVAIGGLIYWLAGKAMGGSGNFWHGVSAWVYASFPPTLVGMLANILILFLKSADDIDVAMSQRGLIHANPGFFIDGKTMPVLATLLGTIDFFQIWGWILAAIGLQKIFKISKTSAWTIVLILALVSLAFRIIMALVTGNPM